MSEEAVDRLQWLCPEQDFGYIRTMDAQNKNSGRVALVTPPYLDQSSKAKTGLLRLWTFQPFAENICTSKSGVLTKEPEEGLAKVNRAKIALSQSGLVTA